MARSRLSTNASLRRLTQAALARHDLRAGSWLGTKGTYRTRNFAVMKITPRKVGMTPLRGLERSGAPSVSPGAGSGR